MTDTNGAAFDDLTLGEVEMISLHALGGKSMGDETADALMVAGGMLWISQRREDSTLTWDAFKATVRMSDIRAYSKKIDADNDVDPTNGHNAQVT